LGRFCRPEQSGVAVRGRAFVMRGRLQSQLITICGSFAPRRDRRRRRDGTLGDSLHLQVPVGAQGQMWRVRRLRSAHRANLPPVGSNVARIFRGERPQDLPVQQPTTFELAINLRADQGSGADNSGNALGNSFLPRVMATPACRFSGKMRAAMASSAIVGGLIPFSS
jgi:hypothetical protein